MDHLQLVVLALVQGLTEFLPISSSAHLILVPRLLGWPDQGLAFDVAVHVGTLLAVVIYFRAELVRMARAWAGSLITRRSSAESRLAWAVLWGTVPVGAAGLLLEMVGDDWLRSPLIIAVNTVLFGILLWWVDARFRGTRTEHDLSWWDVLVVGVAQAVALLPGTSRSGITMTAGLALGLSATGAARFSFLLSIPVIVLAGGLKGLELVKTGVGPAWSEVLIGVGVSAVSAFLCIRLFLAFVQRVGMAPFAIYRLLLGFYLFYLFL